ncbi:MAG: hypothetical protein ACLGH3_09275 [Actinomycetota bacterium]
MGSTPAHAAPSNDNLGSAPVIKSVPYSDSRNTSGSTIQSGERSASCAPPRATVWYEIKLDTTTPISVSTYGSGFDTTLAVWVGTSRSFPAFQALQCNNDMGTRKQSMLGWVAEPGIRYFLQVGGVSGSASGTLQLKITYGGRLDKPDQEIGPQSTASTIAIGADQTGIDLGTRTRESFCYFGLCIPILEVQGDARMKPTVPPQQGIEDCFRVIVVFSVVERCGPF